MMYFLILTHSLKPIINAPIKLLKIQTFNIARTLLLREVTTKIRSQKSKTISYCALKKKITMSVINNYTTL